MIGTASTYEDALDKLYHSRNTKDPITQWELSTDQYLGILKTTHPAALETFVRSKTFLGLPLHVKKHPEVMTCTKENPMPQNRDQMGQVWMHIDAVKTGRLAVRLGEYQDFNCPNCGQVFACKLGEPRKPT